VRDASDLPEQRAPDATMAEIRPHKQILDKDPRAGNEG
jgi:hypothetical protein